MTTPVSLTEVKAHCRVDGTDSDAVLTALLNAAVDHLDGYSGILGRCMVEQSWRVDLADWPAGGLIRLPFPDVSAITSIKYYDEDNAEQTVDGADYQRVQDVLGSVVRLVDNFDAPAVYDDRLDAVHVTFVAGFGNAAAVPAPLKVAIMLLVSHWFEHREASVVGGIAELPFAVSALVAPYRRVGV
ncbi:MAG: head-tail connector protein [Mesorhizobium sp.]